MPRDKKYNNYSSARYCSKPHVRCRAGIKSNIMFKNLLDVAALLLIITSAVMAYKCGNTSAMLGWIVAAIWLIRCKLTELV